MLSSRWVGIYNHGDDATHHSNSFVLFRPHSNSAFEKKALNQAHSWTNNA
jgi:hypothetical protein